MAHVPAERSLGYKSPVSVWKGKQFVPISPSAFMPVQRVASKYAWLNIQGGSPLVVPWSNKASTDAYTTKVFGTAHIIPFHFVSVF